MSRFYIVASPIGNLKDITLRALEILRAVDVIFCEDTRHSLKLLNAYEIQKPLKSAPYFKEREAADQIIEKLKLGQSVAYLSDAGTPALSDPGAILVHQVRAAGFEVEVIGGISSLSCFLAGCGWEWESFRFIGFLPPRKQDRLKIFQAEIQEPVIFFESPHRIESTLDLLIEHKPDQRISLAKEITKISEQFYLGPVAEVKKEIKSFKGEWIGALLPQNDRRKEKDSEG